MKKNVLALTLTLLLPLMIPTFAASDYIRLMPDVTLEMTSPVFWIDKLDAPNAEVLSAEQVARLNQDGYDSVKWINNLPVKDWTQSRSSLTASIDTPFPSGKYYVDATLVSNEYKQVLRDNLNIDGVQDVNPPRYGFATKRTVMKTYPTADVISDAVDDLAYDHFQLLGILTGDPLVVMHESLDGKYLYCVNYLCFGWIPKSDIAICRNKDEWLEAQECEDLLVVTGNKLTLDQNPFDARISGMELYMGTRLPLVPVSEVPDTLYGRRVYGNYVVKTPVTGQDGFAEFVYLPVPISADVHVGYLPYTYENILKQVFKMQGDRYGWGGMLNARDCSELTLELYRCFGLDIPRNTNWQIEYVGGKIDLTGMSTEEKLDILTRDVKPGALLRFPGHITVYLGEHEGKHYVMSAVGNIAEYSEITDTYVVARTRTVFISTLDVRRASGKTWLDDITTAVCLDRSYMTDETEPTTEPTSTVSSSKPFVKKTALAKPTKLKLTKSKATWKAVKNNNGYSLVILQETKKIKTVKIKKGKTSWKIPKSLFKKGRKYRFTLVAEGMGNYKNSRQAKSKAIKVKNK